MIADARLLWLPGWSVGSTVWQAASERAAAGASTACSFADCRQPDELLETARAALEEHGEPVGIVGWSLGAMIALELARDHPSRVHALYLVGATDRFVAAPGETGGWPERVLRRMSARLEDDPGGVLEAFDRRMFSPSEQRAGQDERWIDSRDGAPPALACLRAGLDYLSRFSVEPGRVRAPAFLLHGSEDAICPLAGVRRLASALPVSRLTVWEDAGHAPFFTEPDRFRQWLDTCRRT